MLHRGVLLYLVAVQLSDVDCLAPSPSSAQDILSTTGQTDIKGFLKPYARALVPCLLMAEQEHDLELLADYLGWKFLACTPFLAYEIYFEDHLLVACLHGSGFCASTCL